jgi:hypothetical protein
MQELREQKAATLALLGRLFPGLPSTQSIEQLEKAAIAHIKVKLNLPFS